ncbi:MAG: 2,3-diphosphoglycerate-dependent phosphoglycerate mutase [Bacteroidetes bacterium]|nr:2,3-diphosphoglycerate-dependent phosphoglycerate mutase [Bacteroidota bacterium]
MKRLVLLRHGESIWNKDNRFTGWIDIDLSEYGIEEAKEAGRIFKKEGYHFDVAFTSYLKRAIRTLWLVLDEMDMMWIPVYKTWRLNEKHYGMLQGMNKKEMASMYGEEQVLLWRRSYDLPPAPLDYNDERHPRFDPKYKSLTSSQIPATEALKDTVNRLTPYWNREIMDALKVSNDVLIAAHGNSLRAVVKILKGISDKDIVNLNLPTGIPYVFDFDDHLKVVRDYFIGDEEEIKKKMERVANQGKK